MGKTGATWILCATSFKREHEKTEETEENAQRSIAAVEQIHGLVTEVVGGLRMFKLRGLGQPARDIDGLWDCCRY